jgi:hypothetical protein
MNRTQKVKVILSLVVMAMIAVMVAAEYYLAWLRSQADQYGVASLASPAKGFSGASRELQRTVVVPTLDTPIPEGKNAVWCGSFQLAWNRLAKDVIHAPPEVENAEEIAKRLNGSSFDEACVLEDDCYSAAGFVKNDIVEKINAEMRRRFQREPKIEMDNDPAGDPIIAYAYLQATVPFAIPFYDNRETFVFQGAGDDRQFVSSFGIPRESAHHFDKPSMQVDILHYSLAAENAKTAEFIVDPCKTSSPYQIILALIEPKDTLAAAWDEIVRRMNDEPAKDLETNLSMGESLLVPNLDFDISHHFAELEGNDKRLRNPGLEKYFIEEALQLIRFKLDKSGAELRSEAIDRAVKFAEKERPRAFVFDRPFLIAIRKRGIEQPFFMLWVANGEMLLKDKMEHLRKRN